LIVFHCFEAFSRDLHVSCLSYGSPKLTFLGESKQKADSPTTFRLTLSLQAKQTAVSRGLFAPITYTQLFLTIFHWNGTCLALLHNPAEPKNTESLQNESLRTPAEHRHARCTCASNTCAQEQESTGKVKQVFFYAFLKHFETFTLHLHELRPQQTLYSLL